MNLTRAEEIFIQLAHGVASDLPQYTLVRKCFPLNEEVVVEPAVVEEVVVEEVVVEEVVETAVKARPAQKLSQPSAFSPTAELPAIPNADFSRVSNNQIEGWQIKHIRTGDVGGYPIETGFKLQHTGGHVELHASSRSACELSFEPDHEVDSHQRAISATLKFQLLKHGSTVTRAGVVQLTARSASFWDSSPLVNAGEEEVTSRFVVRPQQAFVIRLESHHRYPLTFRLLDLSWEWAD